MNKFSETIMIFLLFLIIVSESISSVCAENSRFLDELSAIESEVSNLGLTDTNPLDQVERLHNSAHLAAPLLFQQLRVIEPYIIKAHELKNTDKDAMHVIWCIRALQSLTNEKFTANTNVEEELPIQKHLGKKNPLPFFAEWMSREMIYVAPQDVQRQIIEKWEIFLDKNPNFKIRTYEFWSDDDWYF